MAVLNIYNLAGEATGTVEVKDSVFGDGHGHGHGHGRYSSVKLEP